TNFTALRLNWKRCQIYLSGYNFKNLLKEDIIKELFHTFNTIYLITRHVDDIDRQLKESLSLRELYYFQDSVYKMFRDGLSADKEQPLYSMAFVRLLNTYSDNAHKFLPEIKAAIGKESVEMGKKMLENIT